MESKGEQDGLDDPLIAENSQDLSIQSLRYSTRALIGSFRDKAKMISTCSNDIKKLLREGYDVNVARSIAEKFFGQTKISFIAIDGTESQNQQLDMLLFYVGAFAYTGQLEFGAKKCECGDVTELAGLAISQQLFRCMKKMHPVLLERKQKQEQRLILSTYHQF